MPRVSKRELDRKKLSLFLDDLYSAVTSLKDKKEVKAFFEDLLTHEEKLMLAKRFQIAMMHELNYLWYEIGDRAKVTDVTVAKIKQKLDRGLGGLKVVTKRILEIKEKKFSSFSSSKSKSYMNLGPELVKAGLGILLDKSKRKRKSKSILS